MFVFRCAPHHVSMESRQTQVDDLSEVFIDCIDSFFSSCTNSRSQIVDQLVYFISGISLRICQQNLQSLD